MERSEPSVPWDCSQIVFLLINSHVHMCQYSDSSQSAVLIYLKNGSICFPLRRSLPLLKHNDFYKSFRHLLEFSVVMGGSLVIFACHFYSWFLIHRRIEECLYHLCSWVARTLGRKWRQRETS